MKKLVQTGIGALGSPQSPVGGSATPLPTSPLETTSHSPPLPTTSASLKPLPSCLSRLRSDIKLLYQDPLPGVCVVVNDQDLTKIHALITGPSETPYEGGFFLFKMEAPYDYPNNPPKVELLTTDFGRVRFNPNLYANGKVCLSILNTWSGPSWSPSQSISSVLLSIQSLMNSKPYCNEPGFENPRNPRDVEAYSECIVHETIRVAFCDMLDEDSPAARTLPIEFSQLIREVAPDFFEMHKETCQKRLGNEGQRMVDPFGLDRGLFRWTSLLKRLESLEQKYGRAEEEEEDDEEEEEA